MRMTMLDFSCCIIEVLPNISCTQSWLCASICESVIHLNSQHC
uniref:Uncharacterized protein n=1 Tax=Anguilla anguilla TaxID=7936 RepID=A0A0E9UYI4_ANGAN